MRRGSRPRMTNGGVRPAHRSACASLGVAAPSPSSAVDLRSRDSSERFTTKRRGDAPPPNNKGGHKWQHEG
jgi:hypothetical protein